MRHDRSHEIFSRAKMLMPGGVNSAARAFGGVGGEPVVFERASGAHLFDVDGNKYIDYIGSWGPMILGHQHPKVVAAVHAAADKAFSFGAPTPGENELAELIVMSFPSIDMVRLVSSGTEATMSAIRVARGFTGRDVLIKFAGNYHGHVDSLLVATGSAAATLGVPNSPGVTAGTAQDTIVCRYNDVEQLQATFAQHGPRIAAVIFEPIVGNMGCVLPSDEFVQALRELTKSHGALLIADEVITGFRVALGGAQERLGFQADLTTLGKIVGGGLPLAAFCGRREIMQHVLPAGKVFHAGTLSGNPLATAAGSATLKELRDNPPYQRLESLAARLESGLRAAAEKARLPHAITRSGSMLTLFFTPTRPTDWDTASQCDTARYAKYFWGLLDRGSYMPCSQYEALFVSAAHTEADIDATTAAATDVVAKL